MKVQQGSDPYAWGADDADDSAVVVVEVHTMIQDTHKEEGEDDEDEGVDENGYEDEEGDPRMVPSPLWVPWDRELC